MTSLQLGTSFSDGDCHPVYSDSTASSDSEGGSMVLLAPQLVLGGVYRLGFKVHRLGLENLRSIPNNRLRALVEHPGMFAGHTQMPSGIDTDLITSTFIEMAALCVYRPPGGGGRNIVSRFID